MRVVCLCVNFLCLVMLNCLFVVDALEFGVCLSCCVLRWLLVLVVA